MLTGHFMDFDFFGDIFVVREDGKLLDDNWLELKEGCSLTSAFKSALRAFNATKGKKS